MAVKPEFRMEWHGLQEFIQNLQESPELMLQVAEKALYIEGEQIMTKAKRLTPVDEGVLRSSGHVRLPVREGLSVVVELGFGGPAGAGENTEDVGYAVYVHEDLAAYHKTGQAKFLEAPLNERKAGMGQRLATRMRKYLKEMGRGWSGR